MTSDELVRAARSRWEEAHAGFRRAALLQGQVSEAIDGDGRLLGSVLLRSQSAVGALQVAQAGNELAALNVKQALQLQALLAVQHRADTADRLRSVIAEEEARHAVQILRRQRPRLLAEADEGNAPLSRLN